MNKKNLFAWLFITIFVSNVFSYDTALVYRENTAATIHHIAKDLAQQFAQSKHLKELQKGVICITPMVESETLQKSLPITKRVSESLLLEMSKKGFLMLDPLVREFEKQTQEKTPYMLLGTYTYYKYEMVIQARIVSRKSGVIVASARVVVPKEALKSVEKLYKKDAWFGTP